MNQAEKQQCPIKVDDALSHFIVATRYPGYWGRGTTIAEAISAARFIVSQDEVTVIRCTPRVRINDVGGLVCPEGDFYAIVGTGKVSAKLDKVVVALR